MGRKVSVLSRSQNGVGMIKKKKLRAAAYCRVSSSSEEQLLSYQNQVSYYKRFLEDNTEYEFVGVYADEGISGTAKQKRESFLQLLEDSKNGKIDVIFTKSVSRFGRNTVDSLESIRKLKEYGVNVVFEKEHIESLKAEGELLLTVLMALSQNESLQQSNNVKWGMRRKYERGEVESIPVGNLLGYYKDKCGKLVINEEEAKIVRHIFDLYLKGYGPNWISRRLEKEGVYSKLGHKKWSYSTIVQILKNEKYRGDILCQKTYNMNFLTKRAKKNKGELPQYYVANTHPEIIEKRIWDVVKLMRERNIIYTKEHHIQNCSRDVERLPMTGKIVCKNCGHTFGRRNFGCTKKDPNQYHWRCTLFYKKGAEKIHHNICIPDKKPTQLFIEAWNLLRESKVRYQKEPENILEEYRREELEQLFQNGPLQEFDHELMLRTLDHMEIGEDGYADVYFYAGAMVKIKI